MNDVLHADTRTRAWPTPQLRTRTAIVSAPSRNALVIDDDWDTAKLIENVLQAAGFSTYICVRGEDAIEQSVKDREVPHLKVSAKSVVVPHRE